jgi:hypothetical protein
MSKRPCSREEEEYLLESAQPFSHAYDVNDTHSDRDYDEAKETLLSNHRSQHLGGDVDVSEETLVEEPGTTWKLKSSLGDEDQWRKRRRRTTLGVAVFLIFMILAAVWGRPLLLPAQYTPQVQEGLALQNDPHAILSNGTHQYQKTVLLVSIDGLRLVTSPLMIN